MNDVEQPVILEREGAVGRIFLNRPERINAINDGIRHGLPAALRQLERDEDIRIIVIAGNGSKGFCAGADILEIRPAETPIDAHRRMAAAPWIQAFGHVTKPIIAAIHGACMGGGFEIALACDIRMASADALFALPETGLGLIPGAGGTQRLPRLIGVGRALDMMLSNERVGAEEALRLGIVTRLAATREELLDQAHALALQIAAKPPTATAFLRRAVKASEELSLDEGLALERDLFALLLVTEDRIEAARAFQEKRVPNFRGR